MPISRQAFMAGKSVAVQGERILAFLAANPGKAFTAREIFRGILPMVALGALFDDREYFAAVEDDLRWLRNHARVEARAVVVKNLKTAEDEYDPDWTPTSEIVYYCLKS
jgi:hypothetical protein